MNNGTQPADCKRAVLVPVRGRIDAIVIDFSEAFGLVPHVWLLMKIVISGLGSTVVAWVRELLLGRTKRVERQ